MNRGAGSSASSVCSSTCYSTTTRNCSSSCPSMTWVRARSSWAALRHTLLTRPPMRVRVGAHGDRFSCQVPSSTPRRGSSPCMPTVARRSALPRSPQKLPLPPQSSTSHCLYHPVERLAHAGCSSALLGPPAAGDGRRPAAALLRRARPPHILPVRFSPRPVPSLPD